jgi:hypothetical protein
MILAISVVGCLIATYIRDMFNILVGTTWQCCFVLLAMYLVTRSFRNALITFALLACHLAHFEEELVRSSAQNGGSACATESGSRSRRGCSLIPERTTNYAIWTL